MKTLGYWAFLAFLRSSLMLCVTTKISTDLGSFPLVWVTPIFFDRLLEYPVTIALIALLLIRRPSPGAPREIALGPGLSVDALLPLLVNIGALTAFGTPAKTGLAVAILGAILLTFTARPLVSATATAAMVGVWSMSGTANVDPLDRSFFGVHVVTMRDGIREYSNGNTAHGAQIVAETTGKPTPLTYSHPRGLMAQIINDTRKTPARTIGIIGLGTGALACYTKPYQDWHFYEIDPMVVEIAQDTRYFAFLSNCAPDAKIHVGDARIVLQDQTDLKYDILVIDAYSSDAIPMHLATVEAVQLYLDRQNPGGVLVFHVSNRFYDVTQALSVAARELALEGRYRAQSAAELEGTTGANISRVVTLARAEDDLGVSATDPAWQPLPEPRIKLWTDDCANLLAELK